MGRVRPKMPTARKIREYWAHKLVRLDKFDSVLEVLEDNYCFACGFKMELFRCHIIAACEGGPHTVDNLHMLCHNCHRASEYLKGDQYWKWFKERGIIDVAIQEYVNKGGHIRGLFGG